MKALCVVIVDDSAICREALRLLFEVEGDIEVVGEAADGASAVSLIASLAPDLATMDLQMPGKGGLATIGMLRAAIEAGGAAEILPLTAIAERLIAALRRR